jgi:hypothetical protein
MAQSNATGTSRNITPQATGFSQVHTRGGGEGGGQAMSVLLSWHEKVRCLRFPIQSPANRQLILRIWWRFNIASANASPARRDCRSRQHRPSDDRPAHRMSRHPPTAAANTNARKGLYERANGFIDQAPVARGCAVNRIQTCYLYPPAYLSVARISSLLCAILYMRIQRACNTGMTGLAGFQNTIISRTPVHALTGALTYPFSVFRNFFSLM